MMKYIVSGFGVIILGAGMTYGITTYQKNNIDYQSESYAEQILPKITSNWNPDEIVSRAHPEMMRGTDLQTITQMNAIFKSKLGTYKDLDQCTGRAMVVQSSGNNLKTTANYHCRTIFEKGNATVTIGLLRDEDKAWRISHFNVESSLLQQ
jgi:hypothetical protein